MSCEASHSFSFWRATLRDEGQTLKKTPQFWADTFPEHSTELVYLPTWMVNLMGSWYTGKYAIVTLSSWVCGWNLLKLLHYPKKCLFFSKTTEKLTFSARKKRIHMNSSCLSSCKIVHNHTGCWTHPGGYSTFPTLDGKECAPKHLHEKYQSSHVSGGSLGV